MNEQRVTVSGKYIVLTYAYLYDAASFALKQATNSEEGGFYHCLYSIVMNAFCLEAYLNHVGMDRFPDWDEYAAPLDKLERIAKAVGIEIDYGKRPFQSIRITNKFRNLLAHGRTDVLPISYTERGPSNRKLIRSRMQWERRTCTKRNAKRYLEDLAKVIQMIHKQYKFEWPAFGHLGHGFYSGRLINDEHV